LFGQVDAVEGGEQVERKDIELMEMHAAVEDLEKDGKVTHVELSSR